MALPDLNAVKRYLRKQTTNEDTLLAALLASAIGRVETYLRRPIEAESRTFVDEASGECGLSVACLMIPVTPVGTLTSVTDADGTALTLGDLRVSSNTGIVKHRDGELFANGPYTIVANVGLSLRPGYATRIEPVITQAILDTVADLYQARNPRAAAENAGGGVSVAYTQGNAEGVPMRVAAMLAPFRMVGVS
jgi:hypothetical protein